MKYLLPLVFIPLALSACDDKGSENANKTADRSAGNANVSAVLTPPDAIKPSAPFDPNFKPCNPYFPLTPGSTAKYTIVYGTGLVADVTVVVDATDENGRKLLLQKEQIVDKSGGSQKLSETQKTYYCEDGNIGILKEKGNNKVEQYENVVETLFGERAYVMPRPIDLKPGRTWSYVMTITLTQPGAPPVTLDPANRFLEYDGQEVVSVPAGKFATVKIGWKLREKKGTDYYARGIGLVKRVGDDGTTWELKEYSGLSPQD